MAQWWGPRGFTLTTHSKDLRPGGHWTYTMHGPDGVDYPNTTQYFEVEKHAKLVYDHGGNDDRPPLFRVTVLFSEIKGKTKMEMSMTLATPEAAEETRKVHQESRRQFDLGSPRRIPGKGIDRQGAVRHQPHASTRRSRLMFEMWTDPKHFSQWLPPTGFRMEFIRCRHQARRKHASIS